MDKKKKVPEIHIDRRLPNGAQETVPLLLNQLPRVELLTTGQTPEHSTSKHQMVTIACNPQCTVIYLDHYNIKIMTI